MSIYLGFDLSTQGLSAICVSGHSGEVVAEVSVNFGADLPKYNALNGFFEGEQGEVFSSPLMWLDAIDLVCTRLKGEIDLSSVCAISGSGQQHATVYLNKSFNDSVAKMEEASSLSNHFEGAFSRSVCPIWMDNSTTSECEELAQALGGADEILRRTGSLPIERFSGAQIRKFYKQDKAAYNNTSVIHLASSFFASIISGKSTSIDFGDGAGMNLMNLEKEAWDTEIVEACAKGLGDKLPPLAPSNEYAGDISEYFVRKYGFASGTKVYLFTGDNPSSLIGCGGALPGTAIISLGTSDTLFASMPKAVVDKNGYGHVFGNPAGGNMSLSCFRNGSLTREKLRDRFNLDWDGFAKTLETTSSDVELPWLIDELTPQVSASSEAIKNLEKATDKNIISAFVRGHFLSMLYHSKWMGLEFSSVILTGGASENNAIAQVVADIFQAVVRRLDTSSSAGLGAAMRAYAAHTKSGWSSVNELFLPENSKPVKPNKSDTNIKLLKQKFAERISSLID